jgi:subtilisin family serine protease
MIRVAFIDSGVNPSHPHAQPISGGVRFTPSGADECFTDYLGHGTAVAGAIREKTRAAELYAVKIFDRTLATSGEVLLAAMDWCLQNHMDFVNLSLGTTNAIYLPAFRSLVQQALQLGTTIVSANEMNGQPALPGSLSGVIGVRMDNSCPRRCYRRFEENGRTLYAAAGFPRDIPGVPPSRNLHGISFAVANVTGFLAAQASEESVSFDCN